MLTPYEAEKIAEKKLKEFIQEFNLDDPSQGIFILMKMLSMTAHAMHVTYGQESTLKVLNAVSVKIQESDLPERIEKLKLTPENYSTGSH